MKVMISPSVDTASLHQAERFGYVSKMQKFQLLFYDICLHQFFDLCCGQIGTVDFFMTAGTGTFNSLVVVLASEKIQVPYLRFPGMNICSALAISIFLSSFAQVHCNKLHLPDNIHFLTMKIFHISASCNNSCR